MNDDFSRFFKPGCVHRQLYTDPAIFELEMARIFGTAWVYIGHESQVRKPAPWWWRPKRAQPTNSPAAITAGPIISTAG
jgi:hypothetical protein